MTAQKGGAIVDLGNVIIAHWVGEPTTDENFAQVYVSKPPVLGAFDALWALNHKFGGNVTVVYNATDVADELIHDWLARNNFVERTGIPLTRVCRTIKRGSADEGRDKTYFIDQRSESHEGTTVVVDDRLQVLSHFVGKVPDSGLFLFRPQEEDVAKYRHTGALDHVQRVESWREIMSVLNNE